MTLLRVVLKYWLNEISEDLYFPYGLITNSLHIANFELIGILINESEIVTCLYGPILLPLIFTGKNNT